MKMEWQSSSIVLQRDLPLKVRQVYTWCITTDRKFLIVSKDNKTWQLPGGKPKAGESFAETAERELFEETGVADNDLSSYVLFGYYRVSANSAEEFLQVRMYNKLSQSSVDLWPNVHQEDQVQNDDDKIIDVQTVSLTEAEVLIPWLLSSGEYKEIRDLNLL